MDDGIEVSFFGESHFENQVITITDDVECLDIPIILSPTDIEELIQILKWNIHNHWKTYISPCWGITKNLKLLMNIIVWAFYFVFFVY